MKMSFLSSMTCAALIGLAASQNTSAAGFVWNASSLGNGDLGTSSLLNPVSGISSIISGNQNNLGTKTVGGIKGLGVVGGTVGNEIDVAGESVTFTFSAPTLLSSLTLGAMFQPGQFGDTVFEKAKITVNGGTSYFLKVTGNTTASWSGSGTVNNVAPATQPNGGAFVINNPFNSLVSTLTFTAVKRGDGTYRDSDYTVVSLAGQSRDVPEPSAALASLGLLVGAAIFGLRRKH